MQQILIKNIKLPDWSFKNTQKDQLKSLNRSIKRNGQTKNIIVRRIDDAYEIIDGREVFKILTQMEKDYVWCYVYNDVTDLESMLLYLEHDFYFENNFVEIARALQEIHNEFSKLEISKHTKYTYSEIEELLNLGNYDFSRFKTGHTSKQSTFF